MKLLEPRIASSHPCRLRLRIRNQRSNNKIIFRLHLYNQCFCQNTHITRSDAYTKQLPMPSTSQQPQSVHSSSCNKRHLSALAAACEFRSSGTPDKDASPCPDKNGAPMHDLPKDRPKPDASNGAPPVVVNSRKGTYKKSYSKGLDIAIAMTQPTGDREKNVKKSRVDARQSLASISPSTNGTDLVKVQDAKDDGLSRGQNGHAKPFPSHIQLTSNGVYRAPATKTNNGRTPKNNERKYVVHNYTDHSSKVPASEYESKVQQMSIVSSDRRKALDLKFIVKLHFELENIDEDDKGDIISWMSHGRSFRIHDRERFISEILPRYFNMRNGSTSCTSFMRQLHMYGFTRLTRISGPDQGSYYNELFLRGRAFLTCRIKRIKVNGKGYKHAANPLQEPNFYKMVECVNPASASTMNGAPSNGKNNDKKCTASRAKNGDISALPRERTQRQQVTQMQQQQQQLVNLGPQMQARANPNSGPSGYVNVGGQATVFTHRNQAVAAPMPQQQIIPIEAPTSMLQQHENNRTIATQRSLPFVTGPQPISVQSGINLQRNVNNVAASTNLAALATAGTAQIAGNNIANVATGLWNTSAVQQVQQVPYAALAPGSNGASNIRQVLMQPTYVYNGGGGGTTLTDASGLTLHAPAPSISLQATPQFQTTTQLATLQPTQGQTYVINGNAVQVQPTQRVLADSSHILTPLAQIGQIQQAQGGIAIDNNPQITMLRAPTHQTAVLGNQQQRVIMLNSGATTAAQPNAVLSQQGPSLQSPASLSQGGYAPSSQLSFRFGGAPR